MKNVFVLQVAGAPGALLATLVRGRLNAKPLCAIFERVLALSGKGNTWEDFVRVPSSHVLGPTMLDVTFVDKGLLETLRSECGFEADGEIFSIKIASFPTLKPLGRPYVAPWSVLDVGAGAALCYGTVEVSQPWWRWWGGDTVVLLKEERGAVLGAFDLAGAQLAQKFL